LRCCPGGQPSYIAPDHLGAPHQITNASSRVEWQWDHDPFGNGLPTGSFSYGLRFPRQVYDQRSKLHYNYFRDYDPNTGRYIESDPIGLAGGVNTYGYVGGNPLWARDPSGENPLLIPLIIGGAVGGVAGAITTGNAIGWS
jgi:RHS repeat-associated protein